MRKLIEMMYDDLKDENIVGKDLFVYGIIVPLVLVVIMSIAGWMDTLV